ncbi:MAG: carboxymuconolactone decarboxylase family protein [Desulfomonilia bacterium]
MGDCFRKRVYDLGSFFRDVGSLGKDSIALIVAFYSGRVNKAFREKLSMAVTGVLGCRYCSWLHSEMALSHGVKSEELQKILSNELGDFPQEQAVALAFAQHYSETGGKPQIQTEQRFYEFYGPEISRDILLNIKIIYFGNLSGNTIDAFFSRVKGAPHEESSLWSELVILFLLGPYFFIVLPLLAFAFHYRTQLKRS